MFRIMFLSLILMSSVALAQTIDNQEQIETPRAYIFAELGKAKYSEIKENTEKFYVRLKEEKTSQGYVINYGKSIEVAKREKQLRESINLRCDYNCPRMTLISSENDGELKTIFWIVPEGANAPIPDGSSFNSKPEALNFDDFDKVSEAYYMHSFNGFFKELI